MATEARFLTKRQIKLAERDERERPGCYKPWQENKKQGIKCRCKQCGMDFYAETARKVCSMECMRKNA